VDLPVSVNSWIRSKLYFLHRDEYKSILFVVFNVYTVLFQHMLYFKALRELILSPLIGLRALIILHNVKLNKAAQLSMNHL